MSASPDATTRARRQATLVAAAGAAIPTVLAAQGMTSLATDVLGFPVFAAAALAGFLELALVSSALLARAAALAGRPGGADAAAVWVVSGTSGLLAGSHELVVTTTAGSSWSIDPGSVLAGAVRAVAPLVAAWLWERVLQAARAEHAERTLTEIRRDRRLLAVARAALVVRRLEQAGRSDTRRGRRARRRLDRAHMTALRVAPPVPTLTGVLSAVGQVDHLPSATVVAALSTCPNAGRTGGSHLEARPGPDAAAAAIRPGAVTVRLSAEEGSDSVGRTSSHHGAVAVRGTTLPSTLTLAVRLVQENPSISGARLAEELTRQGRPVSARSGQRWRTRAVAFLMHEGSNPKAEV